MKDKLLDSIGAFACVAVTQLPDGLPWYVKLAVTGVAFICGRMATKGVPVYSSLVTPKADKRGQIADSEDPR